MDAFTYTRVKAVLEAALREGLDPIEHLNRVGLLLTPAQEKRIKLELLAFIIDQYQNWTPVQFLRRLHRVLDTTTQQDLYRAILGWLEDHQKAVQEET